MNAVSSPTCEPNTPTFTFTLSPLYEGIQCVSFIGLGAWILIAIFNWIHRRDPTWAILVLFQVLLLLLFWRRVFKPLPSRVDLHGEDLVFRELPSFWITVQGIQVPIIIQKEIRIPISTMVTEWISGTLTWNDMQKGRSVPLARGKQAHALETWLIQQGLPPGVGDR